MKRPCGECGQDFEALAFLPSHTTCPACADRRHRDRLAEWRRIEAARLPDIAEGILAQRGLAAKERAAALDRVPDALKRALPAVLTRALLDGRIPAAGFGLAGNPGGGKTACMAALLRRWVTVRLEAALARVQDVQSPWEDPWHRGACPCAWVNWPAWSAWAKGTVGRKGGMDQVEDEVERLIRTPLLILDDLGRERTRGSYTEDLALGHLDRILDARDRDGRPLIWTTNSTDEALGLIYGGAMMSRLLGMAPLVRLPDLPDQRLEAAR